MLVLSFALFLTLFLFVGAAAAKFSTSTDKDYLLGGKSYGRIAVGLSTGATGNSGFILVAAVGLGYTQGLYAFVYPLAFFIGEFLFWTFCASRITELVDSSGETTLAGIIIGNEGKKEQLARSLIALLTIVFVGLYLVAQILSSAKILEVLFDLQLAMGAGLTVALILAYCTTGGLRASIWTDIVQAVVMIGLSLGVSYHAISLLGGGEAFIKLLSTKHSEVFSFGIQGVGGYLSYMIGIAFLGFGFCLSLPHLAVRLMAGKDPGEVKKARGVYLLFLYGVWGAMTLFGVACRFLLPELSDPEQGLPAYATTFLSPIVIGMVLAGMFSTIASTADSQLLATSSALSKDLCPSLTLKVRSVVGFSVHYLSTVFVGIIALGFAIWSTSSVYDLVVFSNAVLTSTIGAVLFVRIVQVKPKALVYIFMMGSGAFVSILWRTLGYHEIIYSAAPGFLSALLICFTAQYFFKSSRTVS